MIKDEDKAGLNAEPVDTSMYIIKEGCMGYQYRKEHWLSKLGNAIQKKYKARKKTPTEKSLYANAKDR